MQRLGVATQDLPSVPLRCRPLLLATPGPCRRVGQQSLRLELAASLKQLPELDCRLSASVIGGPLEDSLCAGKVAALLQEAPEL